MEKQLMYDYLKEYFGYDAFREGQETLITAILEGRDVLGIMPTGAGKSICYQIPALMLEGMTIVISPLISLMKDQVEGLAQSGVPAAFLNSSLDGAAYGATVEAVRSGECKLLYIAPERLDAPDFVRLMEEVRVSMVTVDEAHCVSQWGHDFRPAYTRIADFLEGFKVRPILSAFTATATQKVRGDIVELLKLNHPEIKITSFDRANLYFEVRHPKNKLAEVMALLATYKDKSGIIYCATRKEVEAVAEAVAQEGYPAVPYHAGLADGVRRQNQDDFIFDRKPIVVATNAFGMGIDKSNVSFVIHYNMPGDMESYYQEAGRAGRDGEPANCILLYGGRDVRTQQFFIDHPTTREEVGEEEAEALRQGAQNRLRTMTFYCHTTDCLRAYMLKYFGEEAPPRCDHCGSCLHEFEELDITVAAQKILSCMVRTGERFGAKVVADTLRGSTHARIAELGFNTLSTYGIMADTSEKRIRDMINHLTFAGYITVTGDRYPVLACGPRARAVLFEGEQVVMKLPKERVKKAAKKGKKAAATQGQHPDLYERLRNLRKKLAEAQGVPMYVVFSNATLADMCAKLPQTEEQFLAVSGVGKQKLAKYGAEFLAEIAEYRNEPGV